MHGRHDWHDHRADRNTAAHPRKARQSAESTLSPQAGRGWREAPSEGPGPDNAPHRGPLPASGERETPDGGREKAGAGHNHPIGRELASHLQGEGVHQDLQALAAAFIEGFRQAEDKTSYLRLAGVPDAIDGPDGLARRLVDVTVTDGFQVATASPGFASRELVYLPYPGAMVRPRTRLTLTYVSLTGRSDIDLLDFLAGRFGRSASLE